MKTPRNHSRFVAGLAWRADALALALLFACACCLAPCQTALGSDAQAPPLRLLVVTGGHEFETNLFFKTFDGFHGLSYKAVSHPRAHEWFGRDRSRQYDVIVLYDMWQDISETARNNFVARLTEGKGLVILHHAIANYQKWPEYEQILGGRYYLEKTSVAGVEKPRSTWQHDVKFTVKVLDKNHPVTRAVSDFEIHDETYNLFDVAPDVTRLLGTDAPTSGPIVAWAKNYKAARVVYMQLGHDHFAWENPSYQRVLTQAIRWVARRE